MVAGEYFPSKLPEGGKIVVMRSIPAAIDNIRIEAVQKVLDGSGIEILDMQYANWSPEKGFEVMQDYLTRFPQIDGSGPATTTLPSAPVPPLNRPSGRRAWCFWAGPA